MRVILLSRITEPALPFFMAAMRANGISDFAVICDGLPISAKDTATWLERTGGAFERVSDASIYNFEDRPPPFYMVPNHNGAACLRVISEIKPRCLVNAGTPRKLSKEIISSVPQGVINVHPGLLPAYRGACAIEWALYNNDPIGNTAHFLTEDYDAGPIIESEWYEFPKDADYVSIRVRVLRDSYMMAGKSVAKVLSENITSQDLPPQSGPTRTWPPISSECLRDALERLATHNYKFARL